MGLDRQVVAGAKPHYPLSNTGPLSHDDSLPGGPSADTRSTNSDHAQESEPRARHPETSSDRAPSSQPETPGLSLCPACEEGVLTEGGCGNCGLGVVEGGQGREPLDLVEDGNAIVGLAICTLFGLGAWLLFAAGLAYSERPRFAVAAAIGGLVLCAIGAVVVSGVAKGGRK